MKNKFFIVLALLCLLLPCAFVLVGCGEEEIGRVVFCIDDAIYHTVETKGRERITLPSNPSKQGYTFGGWYIDSEYKQRVNGDYFLNSDVKQEIRVYPKWVEKVTNTCVVTVDMDGGTLYGGGKLDPITVVVGESLSIPYVVKQGYMLSGWYFDKERTVLVPYEYCPTQDMTVYAKWINPEQQVTMGGFKLYYKLSNYGVGPEGYVIEGFTPSSTYTNFSIPSHYKNVPIIEIADNAFSHNPIKDSVTSLVIPNSVVIIGANAFDDWDKLETLTIGKGVQVVESNAFAWCSSLKTINFGGNITVAERCFCTQSEWYKNLPDGPVYIDKMLYTYKGAVPNEVTLRSGIEAVAAYAFENTSTIEKITLPSSIKVIGDGAFWGCNNLDLANSNLPADLEVLGHHAFAYTAVTKVKFPAFFITNNIPSWRGLEIYKLAGSVFLGCEKLTEVDFTNSGVRDIQSSFFEGCVSLKSVVFPETVKLISSSVFKDSGVESVEFLSDKAVECVYAGFPSSLKAIYIKKGLKEEYREQGLDVLEPIIFAKLTER